MQRQIGSGFAQRRLQWLTRHEIDKSYLVRWTNRQLCGSHANGLQLIITHSRTQVPFLGDCWRSWRWCSRCFQRGHWVTVSHLVLQSFSHLDFSNRRLDLLARSKWNSQLLQIIFSQLQKHIKVDLILRHDLLVLG